MQKYGILVKAALNIQNREIHMTVGRGGSGVVTIEADLPNIIKKSVTIKQVSADVNKLILYDSADYAATRTYYLHPDLGYDTYDRDRITPVVCEMQAVQHEDGSSFDAAAIRAAHDKFSGLAYSNLIELTMANDDGLVKPERLEFGRGGLSEHPHRAGAGEEHQGHPGGDAKSGLRPGAGATLL